MTEEFQPDPDLAHLLECARADQPSPGTADASWAALQLRLAPGSGGGGSEPSGGSEASNEALSPEGGGAAASAPATKAAALGGLTLLGAGVLAVAFLSLREPASLPALPAPMAGPEAQNAETPNGEPEDADAPRPSSAPPPLAPTSAPRAPAPSDESSPPPGALPRSRHKAPESPKAKASLVVDREREPGDSLCPDLAAEAQLLASIQVQLRDAQPSDALETVNQWRRDCHSPALSQEVLAAEILALCALEREPKALTRARAFHRRWPLSPLAGRLANTCASSAFEP